MPRYALSRTALTELMIQSKYIFANCVGPLAFALVFSLAITSFADPASAPSSANFEGTTTDRMKKIFDGSAPRNAAELKVMQGHMQRLAEKVIASTVAVRLGPAHGSGVIVSQDGYVLTAAHVAGQPGTRAKVILSDGRKLSGKSLGMHASLDAGMIRINEDGSWPFLKMSEADVMVGQWCIATGHPGGYDPARSTVFRVGRILSRGKLLRTDCQLVGGDSGGPLVNMYGRVIGVHSRIGNNLANNQHVPISAYHDHWESLIAGERLGVRPFLGVVAKQGESTAHVGRIHRGSPADAAGIQIGDVVVEFDGHKIRRFTELVDMVRAKEPGDRVELGLTRGEEQLTIVVKLGQQEFR